MNTPSTFLEHTCSYVILPLKFTSPSCGSCPTIQRLQLQIRSSSRCLPPSPSKTKSCIKPCILRSIRRTLPNGNKIDRAFDFQHLKLPVTQLLPTPHLASTTMNINLANPHPTNSLPASMTLGEMVSPTKKFLLDANLPDFVAERIFVSRPRACRRDETFCCHEANTSELLDGVFEVHVHPVPSQDSHSEPSEFHGAGLSQDHVATVALELWFCGALPRLHRRLCWWRRRRWRRRWRWWWRQWRSRCHAGECFDGAGNPVPQGNVEVCMCSMLHPGCLLGADVMSLWLCAKVR